VISTSRVLSIETVTHGRVVVRDATDAAGTIVAFHGYGMTAERMLADLERVPGADRWQIVSVQGLHRFYAKDSQTIMASWMTRQDREFAIADNVEYVNRALDQVSPPASVTHSTSSFEPARGSDPPFGERVRPLLTRAVVFVGFSQGVAMAYRAALLGKHRAAGIIALGGDIPPEFKTRAPREWPPVLIGAGDQEVWYTDTKVRADEATLTSQGVEHTVVRYRGGHEWTDEFREAVAAVLAEVQVERRGP
jgi:predicted esterase